METWQPPPETHFLAWVPTGRASSGTGEAKWSGSPFEARSLTAANLHHLEQWGKKERLMHTKTWHMTRLKRSHPLVEVRLSSSNQVPLCWEGHLTSVSLVSCSHRETFLPSPSICASISPSPALPLKAAIFKLALGPSLQLQSYSSPHTPAAAPLSSGEQIMCWRKSSSTWLKSSNTWWHCASRAEFSGQW